MTDFSKPLRRSQADRAVAGVCGGIAEYFSLDPTLVRVVWAVGMIPSFLTLLLAYLVLWVVIPEREYY